MATLARFILVIPFGFVAACLCAGFALLWPFFDPGRGGGGDPAFWMAAAFGFLAQSAQVGATVLVPWAVFMAVSEILGWRSILLHVAAGLGGGVLVLGLAYGADQPQASIQTAMMTAAVSFALVYWIVAGRAAGRWRRRPRAGDASRGGRPLRRPDPSPAP